jgi:hypothetical protein
MKNIFSSALLLLSLLAGGALLQELNAQQDTVIFYIDTLGVTEDPNDPGLYTIPVRVQNFDTISGFLVSFIQRDTAAMTYEMPDGYINYSLNPSTTNSNINFAVDTMLSLIYFDFSGDLGVTLPDDDKLLDLHLRIDGEPGDCFGIKIMVGEVVGEDAGTAIPARGVGGEFCLVSLVEVSGQINGPEGSPLSNIELELATADSTYRDTSNLSGQYSFAGVPTGEPFTIQPLRKLDVVTRPERLAGVNVGDIVLAQRYLLGMITLPTPQIIAADVSADEAISLVDLTTLAAYVLFKIDDLPGDDIYRFWPSTFEFTDPTNPWSTPIPTMISSDGVNEDTPEQNFIGVKRGDVNSSSY